MSPTDVDLDLDVLRDLLSRAYAARSLTVTGCSPDGGLVIEVRLASGEVPEAIDLAANVRP